MLVFVLPFSSADFMKRRSVKFKVGTSVNLGTGGRGIIIHQEGEGLQIQLNYFQFQFQFQLLLQILFPYLRSLLSLPYLPSSSCYSSQGEVFFFENLFLSNITINLFPDNLV